MQVQGRAGRLRTDRSIGKIMHDLGGGTHQDDLAFEEAAILVIRVPDLVIENLPERMRRIGIELAEAEEMRLQVPGHERAQPLLLQGPRHQRLVRNLILRRHHPRQLIRGQSVARVADLVIQRIREKNHVTHPIVLHLRRRDQAGMRDHVLDHAPDGLHAGEIEVGPHHHFVAVTLQGRVEGGVSVVRRTENQIEDHQARARLKKAVQQQGPDFPRPGEGMTGHQLGGAIAGLLRVLKGRIFQRVLVDPDKNDVGKGDRLAAFAPEEILKTLLAAPDAGKKRETRKKMGRNHKAGPKSTDDHQDEQTVAIHPMHDAIYIRGGF